MVSLLLPVIYLAFISLGLPDSLLGSAWPVMYQELGTSVSSAGIISMIIAAGTIVSSLNSDRLNTRFGTGKITAVSVLTTAVALFGFSVSHSFLALCLWGIPYGLGAGSVDAALNNYVALHYKARHMSWLHCMWGVGCSTGPVVMGYAINHSTWNNGYRTIALFQIVLTLILFFSLPLWQKPSADASADENSVPEQRSFSRLIRVPGVKEVLTCFFCYCADRAGIYNGGHRRHGAFPAAGPEPFQTGYRCEGGRRIVGKPSPCGGRCRLYGGNFREIRKNAGGAQYSDSG